MEGKTLYGAWQTAMLNQGTETDEWDEISSTEQAAWDETAEKVVFGNA